MNNITYDRFNEITTEWFAKTPDYVHMVSRGHKHVNGIDTNEESINFYVLKKLPKNEIPEDELLPSEINIDGYIYKTDVIECPGMKYTASCYSWDPSKNYGITNVNSIDILRRTMRPLRGGVSIANYGGSYSTYAADAATPAEYPTTQDFNLGWGTMGAIVVDNEDNSLVGLTCAHVVVGRDEAERLATSIRTDNNRRIGAVNPYFDPRLNPLPRTYNIIDDTSLVYVFYANAGAYTRAEVKFDQRVMQPGEDADNFTYIDNLYNNQYGLFPNANIGTVKRFTPIIFTGGDSLSIYASGQETDAALISLKQSELDETRSWQFAGLETLFTKPLQFATTVQLNTVNNGMNVWTVGRSTGPKGSGICTPLVINNVNVVGGNIATQVGFTNYRNIYTFKYQDNSLYPTAEGDSGSVVIMDFGTTSRDYRIAGILFGGASNNTYGIFCRIDIVAKQLNISAFTGSGYNDSSITNISRWVSGSSTLNVSGKFCGANSGNYYLAGQVHTDPVEQYTNGGITMGYNSFTIADTTPYKIISGTGTANNCKQY